MFIQKSEQPVVTNLTEFRRNEQIQQSFNRQKLKEKQLKD